MPSCVIYGCFSGGRVRDPSVILHVFPKNLEVIKIWLQQTGQNFGNIDKFANKVLEHKNMTPTGCVLCIFAKMLICITQKKKILRKDAIPTIFSIDTTIDTTISMEPFFKKQ